MPFQSPQWVPSMPFDPPDSIPIADFMQSEQFRQVPLSKSRHPFTCGLTGATYTHSERFARSESLAQALADAHQWSPNEDTPWDKVVSIFSLNTIDYMTVAYATHRLSGIVMPVNATYTTEELAHQLRTSGAKAVFTCSSLLATALQAAEMIGIPRKHVYVMALPTEPIVHDVSITDLDQLICKGHSLPPLERLTFSKGQGSRQTAFLCYSSGTSGQPKAVMISHYNVIANILQHTTYESVGRSAKNVDTQVLLAPLPLSHIYALIVAAHVAVWRGDEYIVLPKYDLKWVLEAIQRFKVQQMLVVPPILLQMLRSSELCKQYDLRSVRYLFSGAAPLGEGTIKDVQRLYPSWTIGQAYGMTETSVCVTIPSEHDIAPRASGSLLPATSVKLLDDQGREITDLEQPGEILVQAPSVVLGYLHNEKANAATFVHDDDGRWIRTGDVGLMSKSSSGNEQLVLVDRIKELIKVMGHQVAPAELEAHLLEHPAVADCAVIPIPDDRAGEIPKAFIIRSPGVPPAASSDLAQTLSRWVTDHKTSYKALRGGVEFVDAIPKSPSGKILRRLLRDQDAEKRASAKSKL